MNIVVHAAYPRLSATKYWRRYLYRVQRPSKGIIDYNIDWMYGETFLENKKDAFDMNLFDACKYRVV
jgi:hypothetical protein